MVDLSQAAWRKARASSMNGGCVEVASNLPGVIAVRDSKRPEGGAHVIGREAFAAWMQRQPQIEQVRYPLLLTMAFGAWVGPDRLLEFAQAHRAAHEERLARYRSLRDDPALDGYTQATVAFGLRYEEAVLGWMAELPAILPPDGLAAGPESG